MAYQKTRTGVVVALLAAIPIGLQWNENRDLRRELAESRPEFGEVESGKLGRHRGGEETGRKPSAEVSRNDPAGAPGHLSHRAGLEPWRRALAVQDPVRRAQHLAELIANLDAKSAPGIAELFFGEGAGGHSESEAALFLRAWAQMDGSAAIAYLVDKNKASSANSSILAALGGWASKDPEAARAWAEAVEKQGLREDLLFGVIDGWALVDFNAAASYAETRPRSEARTRFIDLLFNRSLVAGGIAGAQNWFSGIPDNDHNAIYKRRAFDKVVSTMLRGDPSAAAQWIASQAGEGYVTRNTVQSTAMKLAEASPEEALRWISSMSALAGEIGAGSQGEIISQWAGKDPEAAGTWLSANGSHPNYDTMARQYSAAVAAIDGEGAMEWAQSIQDDGIREAAVLGVARLRIKSEGYVAIEGLRLAGLTEEEISQATQANQALALNNIRFTTSFSDLNAGALHIWDAGARSGAQMGVGDNQAETSWAIAPQALTAALLSVDQAATVDPNLEGLGVAVGDGSVSLEISEETPDPFGPMEAPGR